MPTGKRKSNEKQSEKEQKEKKRKEKEKQPLTRIEPGTSWSP